MTWHTEMERTLRIALAPYAEEAGHGMTDQPWVSGFADWRFGQAVTPALMAALNTAHPLPADLTAAWIEHCTWQAAGRKHVEPHVSARIAGLEHLLDVMPDASISGINARLAWLSHLSALEHCRSTAEDSALAARLAADFREFARAVQSARAVEPKPSAISRRTQADRRAEVLSILDAEPNLSDREIGRRAGVSPQTVSNWRKKLSASCPT